MILSLLLLLLLRPLAPAAQDCRACHAIEEADHAGSIHDLRRIDCVSCHGRDEFDTSRLNPHRRLPSFRGVPEDVAAHCASCHAGVADRFRESRHAAALRGACLACHEPHATRKADWKGLSKRCAECHKAGDPHHGVADELQAGFEAAQGRLVRVDEAISAAREPPGVSLRGARRAREELADLSRGLGEKQHAMDVAGLRGDLERAGSLEEEGRRSLAEEKGALPRRLAWLAVFLLCLLSAGALAACRVYHRSG
jgi:hypothetical protein